MSADRSVAPAKSDAVIVEELWRRGRRWALWGAAIGVACALVLGGGLWALFLALPSVGDLADALFLLVLAGPLLVLVCAEVGLLLAGLDAGSRMTSILRDGPLRGTELRRAMRDGRLPSTPEEQGQVVRFAILAARLHPYQAVSFGLIYLLIAGSQLLSLLSGGAPLPWLNGSAMLLLVALGSVSTVMLLHSARRARSYLERHRGWVPA